MSEVEEKQISAGSVPCPPLPQDLAAGLDLFFAARRAFSLYNEDHPIAARACDNSAAAFHESLATHGRVVFTATDQGLMVNGRQYIQTVDSRSFCRRMLQRGIQILSILPSFDTAELRPLLRLMEIPPNKIKEQGGPRHILESAGVEAISVTELTFADRRPEDQVETYPNEAPEEEPEFERLAALLLSQEEQVDDELYDSLLAVLHDSTKTVSLLALCVSRASPEALQNGKVSLIAQVLRRIENIVTQRSLSDWDQLVPILRQAVAKLPPALRPRVFALEAPAVQEKLEERHVSPQRIDAILAEVAQALGEAMQVPAGLKAAMVGPADLAGPTSPARARGAEPSKSRLAILLEGLAAMRIAPAPALEEFPWLRRQPHQTTCDLAMVLLDVLEKQEDPEQCSAVATKLEQIFGVLLTDGSFHHALKIARYFAYHSEDHSPGPPWRRLRARASLQSMGIPVLLQLGRRGLSQDHDMAEDAAGLLLALGEEGVLSMVTALSDGLPEYSVQAISERLVGMGDGAVPYLRRALQTVTSNASGPLFSVLARLGTLLAIKALAQGLASHDFLVRLNVLSCLSRAPAELALPLILPAVHDKHLAIRRAAIAALGQMHSPASVPHLKRVALSFPLGRQKQAMVFDAIAALGRTGGDEAAAALANVMKVSWWFARGRARQTRLAAIESLKAMGSPAAIEVLRAHTADRDTSVRAACQQALAAMGRPIEDIQTRYPAQIQDSRT
jgi:HEAT repeat protein